MVLKLLKEIYFCIYLLIFYQEICYLDKSTSEAVILSPDALVDTHIDGLVQYGHYGHYGDMAIGTIDAIVDRGLPYRCLKTRLNLRIAASEANFAYRRY